jgi:hypothetical protein
MFNEASEFLFVVNLENAFDLDIEAGQVEYSWEEFKESLLTHRIRNRKDGVGFMPVLTKPQAEWQELFTKEGKNQDGSVKPSVMHYRGDVNIEAITALVIDLDQPGALEASQELFADYERIVHSTHTFTPETPWKYRMIIRLMEPIPVESWPICFEALKSRIHLDPVCCNPSRFYYYPSHSKDANITPRAEPYPGKPISMEDILSMAKDKDVLLQAKSARRTVLSRPGLGGKGGVRTRRHFSGAVIGHYDSIGDNIDVSLAGMTKRHAKSIAEYEIEGSRHNLALSISSRELYQYGPKTDIKSLVLFIFKVAANGNRGLETGNTAEELPGMIVTGMMKYAPEALEKLMAEHDGFVEGYIASITRWASLNYQDAPMTMADIKSTTPDEGDYYAVLRERHKPILHQYVRSGDARNLFKEVLKMELRVENPKYSQIARALVNYLFGYYTKVAKRSEDAAWSAIHSEMSVITRLFSEKHIPVDAQKIKFARSAFIIESSERVPKHVKELSDQQGLALG